MVHQAHGWAIGSCNGVGTFRVTLAAFSRHSAHPQASVRSTDLAKGIQSISLGFRLLRAIAERDEPATLKILAAAAGMSASKARMYLISLIETGLVMQSAQTGLYAL